MARPAENDSAFSTPITAKEVEALPGYERKIISSIRDYSAK